MPKPSEFARLMLDVTGPRDFAREAIIEDMYNLNREIGWAGFRREHFEDAAAVREWPEPDTRDSGLFAFWES